MGIIENKYGIPMDKAAMMEISDLVFSAVKGMDAAHYDVIEGDKSEDQRREFIDAVLSPGSCAAIAYEASMISSVCLGMRFLDVAFQNDPEVPFGIGIKTWHQVEQDGDMPEDIRTTYDREEAIVENVGEMEQPANQIMIRMMIGLAITRLFHIDTNSRTVKPGQIALKVDEESIRGERGYIPYPDSRILESIMLAENSRDTAARMNLSLGLGEDAGLEEMLRAMREADGSNLRMGEGNR